MPVDLHKVQIAGRIEIDGERAEEPGLCRRDFFHAVAPARDEDNVVRRNRNAYDESQNCNDAFMHEPSPRERIKIQRRVDGKLLTL